MVGPKKQVGAAHHCISSRRAVYNWESIDDPPAAGKTRIKIPFCTIDTLTLILSRRGQDAEVTTGVIGEMGMETMGVRMAKRDWD